MPEMNFTRQMSQSKIVGENLTVQDDQVVATLEARLQDMKGCVRAASSG